MTPRQAGLLGSHSLGVSMKRKAQAAHSLPLIAKESQEKININRGLKFAPPYIGAGTQWRTSERVLLGCLSGPVVHKWFVENRHDSNQGVFELRWIAFGKRRGKRGGVVLRFGLNDGTNAPHSGLIIDGEEGDQEADCAVFSSDKHFSGKKRISQELREVQSAGTVSYDSSSNRILQISLDSGHYRPSDVTTEDEAETSIYLSRFFKAWSCQNGGDTSALMQAKVCSFKKGEDNKNRVAVPSVDQALIQALLDFPDNFRPLKVTDRVVIPPCFQAYKDLYEELNSTRKRRTSSASSSDGMFGSDSDEERSVVVRRGSLFGLFSNRVLAVSASSSASSSASANVLRSPSAVMGSSWRAKSPLLAAASKENSGNSEGGDSKRFRIRRLGLD